MVEAKKKVAIIGGGITGLTAAYYLQKKIQEENVPMTYRLFERSERLGGKIQTDYTNGFVIERGPDSFLARKVSATKLAKEVGLEAELVANDAGQSYVLKGEKLYPIPGGSIMGIPTELEPFVTTKLFSPVGKARAALDLMLPRVAETDVDQSLGSFFRKRLGNEVVDHLIEPLLSGIYAGDIDQLSLMATYPQFLEAERKHRSLILGMKKSVPKRPQSEAPQKKKAKGIFLSFRRGLQSLVDAIEQRLAEEAIIKNCEITKVEKQGEKYALHFAHREVELFDYVVVTTPPHVTYRLFQQYEAVRYLEQMPATSVATVALAYPLEKIKDEIDGTGFVVSKNEQYQMTACTWTHKKWEHAAPEGYGLLRFYVGKPGDEAIVSKDDETIVKTVLADVKKVMTIEGEPDFYRITRWKKAMPQYVVGHKQRMAVLKEQAAKTLPGTIFTGASYEGIGVPDCISQGEAAVNGLLDFIDRR